MNTPFEIINLFEEVEDGSYNTNLAVHLHGLDNKTPIRLRDIARTSGTARNCIALLFSFLKGIGFAGVTEYDVTNAGNILKRNINKILDEVCEKIAIYGGCYLHILYNANLKVADVKVLSNANIRVGKKDSKGFNGFFVMSDNGWKRTTRKKIKIHHYNSDPNIISSQIQKAGGLQHYTGQIYYLNTTPDYTYAKSPLEDMYHVFEADYYLHKNIGIHIKNGLRDTVVVYYNDEGLTKNEKDDFHESIKKSTSVENIGRVIKIRQQQRDLIDVQKMDNTKTSKEYQEIKDLLEEAALGAFYNIPKALIKNENNSMGDTSGVAIKNYQAVYYQRIAPIKNAIQEAFKNIFSNHENQQISNNDFQILQTKINDDGTTDDTGI